MDIASRQAHRALAYLAALNKHGCCPTAAQFAAYASDPDPKPPPGFSMHVLTGMLAMYSGPAESIPQYLARVGWVASADGRVRITDLGSTVLAALDAGVSQAEGALDVVLTSDDPFALSRAVQQFAALGPALLIDPYFRLDQLALVVNYTEIDRILMSDQVSRDDRQSLKHALDNVPMHRKAEVRMAKKEEMHDRFVIPPHGPVRFIGTSLGSVGRRLTVLGSLDDASTEVRRHYEALWQESEHMGVVGAARSDDASSEQAADGGAAEDEATSATSDAG